MSNQIRVAIVTNRIPDYRAPIFLELAKTMNWVVRIFLTDSSDKVGKESLKSLPVEASNAIQFRWKTRHRHVNTSQSETAPLPQRLMRDLLTFDPRIIISGNMGIPSLMSYMTAKKIGCPFVIWSEEIEPAARNISFIQKKLRAFLLPKASAVLAWGRPAVQYLKASGVSSEKIYYCTQAIDNEKWIGQSSQLNKTSLKIELGMPAISFLCVGQLIARKGFDQFFRAWASMPAELKHASNITIIGNGPELNDLRKLCDDLRISSRFLPHQNQDELVKYYKSADVFVFPSLVDVWGMVVNESLACGTPVLGSIYAGASQELLANSAVGELIDPLDIPSFSATLARWCMSVPTSLARQAQDLIRQHDYSTTISAFRDVVAFLV